MNREIFDEDALMAGESSGEEAVGKNEFLNKLTTFDLRSKKFPVSTMAQTLIARRVMI